MKLVFASHNAHKVGEIRAILPNYLEVQDLSQIGFTAEIEETGNTFEENALIKSKTVFDFCKIPTFSDDSGLCVDALHGQPGVYTARYAGENATALENNLKLLDALKNEENRNAYFIAVICYYDGEKAYFFEGKVHGKIAKSISGENGFGYDPVFIPQGYSQTFAELGEDLKHQMSHRFLALSAFKDFLKNTSFTVV